jgi:hypothetical protein
MTFENVYKASAEVDEEEKALARKVEAEVMAQMRQAQAAKVSHDKYLKQLAAEAVFKESVKEEVYTYIYISV